MEGGKVVGFEVVLGNKGSIDNTKGLSPEEKRNRTIDERVAVGEVKTGDKEACKCVSINSVKTRTP